MKRSRVTSLSFLAALTLGACHTDAPMLEHGVIIKLDGWPTGSSMWFKPRLDGRRVEQMDVHETIDKLKKVSTQPGIRFNPLPTDSGHFTVDAVVVGADGWPVAEGYAQVDLPAGPTTVSAEMKLAPIDQDECVSTTHPTIKSRWCPVQTPTEDWVAIHGTDRDNLWVLGATSIWRWNGFRWRPTKLPGGKPKLAAIWASLYDEAWAVGDNGAGGAVVWRWNAAVQAWQSAQGPSSEFDGAPPLHALWGSSPNDLWAAGDARDPSMNELPVWHWDGKVWSQTVVVGASTIKDIWGSDASHVWMVGEQNTVLQWDGRAWMPPRMLPVSTTTWSSVWVSPQNEVTITNGSNNLLVGTAKGWTSHIGDQPKRVRGTCNKENSCELWGIRAKTVSGQYTDEMVRMTNPGKWESFGDDRAEDKLSGLLVLDQNSVWAAGARARIWEVITEGVAKQRIDRYSPPQSYLYDLWFDEKNNRLWAFGDRAWRTDGWHWEQVGKAPVFGTISDYLTKIVFLGEDNIWAMPNLSSMSMSAIQHFTKGKWEAVKAPNDFTLNLAARLDGIGGHVLVPGIFKDPTGSNRPAFAEWIGTSWNTPVWRTTMQSNNETDILSCAASETDLAKCVWMSNRSRGSIDLYQDGMWETYSFPDPGYRVVDLQGLHGTDKLWVLATNGNGFGLFSFVKQPNKTWKESMVKLDKTGTPQRLLVKSNNEVWFVGKEGLVFRSNGDDKTLPSGDFSFDSGNSDLQAIVAGNSTLDQVWVTGNKTLWRLVQR